MIFAFYRALPIVAVLVLFTYLFFLLRAHKIKEKYAFAWLFTTTVLLAFAIYPPIADGLAKVLGFKVTSNLLFSGAIMLLLLVAIHLSMAVSKLETRLQRLAEELALARHQLDLYPPAPERSDEDADS